MSDLPNTLKAVIKLPDDFVFGEVSEVKPEPTEALEFAISPLAAPTLPSPAPPSLGPLAAFVGNWVGNGFNTIFRPDNAVTRTQLPTPVLGPPPPRDNVLELNLTSESLSFSPSLGSVPNRGTDPQGDVFLNGVPYLQAINDVTIPGKKIGIHVEPGLWMIVPPTTVPGLGVTLVRMASIPHGTTIEAQGTSHSIAGPPTIPTVDITPFLIGSNPPTLIRFPSQTAADSKTARIPQDLTSFMAAGTITQTLLDNPNSILHDVIIKQKITATTQIDISTVPALPLFGGGTDNIAFLLGQAAATAPNANAVQMVATFWVETVETEILVPPFHIGQPPFALKPKPVVPGVRVPTFSVTPPIDLEAPRLLKVSYTQIQYTQTVLLNFAGLSWPHVSVNTLVPADNIVVPHSAWH